MLHREHFPIKLLKTNLQEQKLYLLGVGVCEERNEMSGTAATDAADVGVGEEGRGGRRPGYYVPGRARYYI